MKIIVAVAVLFTFLISCKKDKETEPDAAFTGTWVIDSVRLTDITKKGIPVTDTFMYFPEGNFTYTFYESMSYKIIHPNVTDTGIYSRSATQVTIIQKITGDTTVYDYDITGKRMKLLVVNAERGVGDTAHIINTVFNTHKKD